VLKVYIEKQFTGSLFKSESRRNTFCFGYDEQSHRQNAVSISMPVVNEQYIVNHNLHPIFDMNIPEGALKDHLHNQFSNVFPDFDDLSLLGIIGKSQIGRLSLITPGDDFTGIPTQDLTELLVNDNTKGLLINLLNKYSAYSGISGAQPKVMVRNSAQINQTDNIYRCGTTHIVKAWNENRHPQLAANEFFCMRAAFHAKLEVPNIELSKNGMFLIVERFDLKDNTYLGFEDFCVLNGKTSSEKYDGAYENITKRIKDFVSPEQVRPALESLFKAIVLSCAVKNGDAHLKNFGVLYDNTDGVIRLSPIYDITSTTPYNQQDILALTLGGTKQWPNAKNLIAFARTHCDITNGRTKELMNEVGEGVLKAADEAISYIHHNEFFRETGEIMLAEWAKGVRLSI